MDKNKLNEFGYKVGYILATVIAICLMVAAIALTVKFFCFWLF